MAGLLPIMWGTGSEVMSRIAAPMVCGRRIKHTVALIVAVNVGQSSTYLIIEGEKSWL